MKQKQRHDNSTTFSLQEAPRPCHSTVAKPKVAPHHHHSFRCLSDKAQDVSQVLEKQNADRRFAPRILLCQTPNYQGKARLTVFTLSSSEFCAPLMECVFSLLSAVPSNAIAGMTVSIISISHRRKKKSVLTEFHARHKGSQL